VTLAPEIQSLIDWGATIGESLGSLPLPERRVALRDELDAELRRRGVLVEPTASTQDHRVRVANGEIRVRAFTPDGAGPHPLFLHFHGGGWVFGTIDSLVNNAKCAHICSAAECVVVTVDYRLAPEHRFPAAPEDCYAALLWAIDNADSLRIDPARIAVGGESAGGNLAAAVALMARDLRGPQLTLQMLEVPVTDISDGANDHPSVALYGEGYGLSAAEMDFYAAAYLAKPADGSNPYASPLLASDLAGVAPAHVITAEYDVLRDAGEAYARRLAEAGVETTLHRAPRHTHGSSVLWQSWKPASEWMNEATAAIRRALRRRRSAREDGWRRSSSTV
jgi:acetyl esterase